MTPDLSLAVADLIEQARELSARIGALTSLGAGFAAALYAGTMEADDMYLLLDGYVGDLRARSQALTNGLQSMDAKPPAGRQPSTDHRGDRHPRRVHGPLPLPARGPAEASRA